MANLTSTLKVSLIDDVSKPARTVAQALRDAEKAAEAVAKGMGKSGSDPFRRQLASLKLTANELKDVRKEWLLYARAQKQAMGAQQWATRGQGVMLAKEKQILAAAKASRKEQMAAYKATVLASRGGRLGAMGGKASDFASMALPGAAGMALGLGGTAAAGLMVGGAATYAGKQAIDFNKAMADVRKKTNLSDGMTFADVERMINRTALSTGTARTEVAALAATAGQAGIEVRDLSGFMDLTSKAAAGWDVPVREAAQKLAELKTSTGMTIPQLKEMGDMINHLGDTGAASEADILEMASRTLAATKASGLKATTTLALVTALKSTGMQEEVAARFTNVLAQRLSLAASLTPKIAQGFKEIGLNAKDIEKGMKIDPEGTMIKYLDALSKSPNKMSSALKTGGQEWADEFVRAADATGEVVKNLEGIESGAWKGSLDRSFSIDLDTTEKKFERLKVVASELADVLARPMLPGLNRSLDDAIDKIENFIHPKGPSTGPGSLAGYEARLGLDGANQSVPTFQKLQNALRMREGRGVPSWAYDPTAGRMGVEGGISPNHIPTFQRIHAEGPSLATPSGAQSSMAGADLPGTKIIHVEADTAAAQSQIDSVKQSAESIPSNVSTTVNVNAGSAIAELQQVVSLLGQVERGAGAAVAAAGRAKAATSGISIPSITSVQQSNYNTGGAAGAVK